MSAQDRIERARALYERAVFVGDADALPAAERDLDAVEADLALARGRILHGRCLADRDAGRAAGRDTGRAAEEDQRELALFERAAELYRALGDPRGEGEAWFWIGVFHQVIRRDHGAALPALERSRDLAERSGDPLTLSYALRHLGIAEHVAGRLDEARERLTESVRLRRQVGFLPGVAANLVGLAYIASGQQRRDDALALLAEAGQIAAATGARAIARQVEEARVQV